MFRVSKTYLVIIFVGCILTLIFYSLSLKNGRTQEKEFIPVLEMLPAVNSFHNNSKLFNLTLKYLLTSQTCNVSSEFLAVIIVTSYFGNVETRSAMRRTLSMEQLKSLGLRRVFLLGIATKDKYTTQKSIEDESRKFGDILQGNFVEAYKNLTYKHMMGLRWAAQSCSRAKYIIKMDDDIVVDFIRFTAILTTMKLPREAFAGYILRGMMPIREPQNKWFVTREEYSENSYPTFVSGWFYITTPDVASKIFHALSIFDLSYFWIDDLFVTGIVAQKLNIRHYDIGRYFAVHSEYIECCMSDIKKDRFNCDFLVGPNGGDNNLFYEFNKAMRICDNSACFNRTKPVNETCVAERKIYLGRGDAIVKSYNLH